MRKIEIFKPIVKELCKKYDISIRWNDFGDQRKDGLIYWWADPERRVILVPNPKTAYRFLICLHEIGHIVRGVPNLYYMAEYIAEEWAIKEAAKYGVRSTKYEKKAADLLIAYINHDINNGRTSKKRISKKVKKWIKKRTVFV